MRYTWEETGVGVVDTLGKQFQKVIRSCNQGSIETRHTYIPSFSRFIKFVGPEFKLQKIQNLKDKHLQKYAEYLKEKGCTTTYITKELSAIRFVHNQTNDTKYELMESNDFNQKILELEYKKADDKPDRSWTDKEIANFKELTEKLNRPELAKMADACLALGLRTDEAATLKTENVEKALKENKLHLTNTKGGRPRTIYLNKDQREVLEKIRETAGEVYAIVPAKYVESRTIHKFKDSLRNFIYRHQDKIKDSNRDTNCTAHGWRHTFAQNLDERLQDKGYSEDRAALKVGNSLGHGNDRPDITATYLHR